MVFRGAPETFTTSGFGMTLARIRVLVLTTTLPGKVGDGTPEFVLSLATSLSDRFDITILSPRVKGSSRKESVGGVTIRRFPYFPERWEGLADGAILPNLRAAKWRMVEIPPLMFSFSAHAFHVARATNPHVVHAHWLLPAGAVALGLKRLLDVPYVVTVHGADAYTLRAKPFQWMKRTVLKQAHTVSPVSRDIATVLGFSLTDARRLVVPMGVDVPAIQSAVGERKPQWGRFLFVGRLVDKKGVDVLLHALSRVPEANLIVVGDGPERGRLVRLTQRLGIVRQVSFRGVLPRASVLEELRVAHAIVIPSRVGADRDQEGTPVVLGEAMAGCVPVIASRLGGIVEHVEDDISGFLVEPGSSESIASALRRALDEPETLHGLAKTARERIEGRLDLETTSRRYSEFLLAAAQSSLRP